MTDFTIDTLRSIYITNQPYRYPLPWLKKQTSGTQDYAGDFNVTINTGWHIIPNLLWGHVCNPRQWNEMMIKYEAIKVNSIHCRIFNPIPIQTALSFQGNATFPAFNNTVYALGYTDEFYETPWFNWRAKLFSKDQETDIFYQFNPAYKEGIIPKPRTDKFTQPSVPQTPDNYHASYRQYPKQFTSQTTKEVPLFLQDNQYKRQFLPIYWYSLGYGQYVKTVAAGSYISNSGDFELAYTDTSGMFWDPLNQPTLLKELRPGKNMIEFSWNAHPVDSNIWFNTDRIALLQPYKRPGQQNQSLWGSQSSWKPQTIDPRGPGNFARDFQYLKTVGLVKEKDPITVAMDRMAPEKYDSVADWRKWPIVPMRWFFQEVKNQNPWVFENFRNIWSTTDQACSAGMQLNDVQLTTPLEDFRTPGTEYEMYKYPPSQWFLKAVPLFDDNETLIKVEMQAFMMITLNLTGKKRRSAIYGPTWGPITPMNLYSINMDSGFQENYMRGRSGGARRTYYNYDAAPPEIPLDPYEYEMFSSTAGEQGTVPFAPTKACAPSGTAGQRADTPYTAPRTYYLKDRNNLKIRTQHHPYKREIIEEETNEICEMSNEIRL
uniref:VP1 n=1 Tax=Grus japonensis Chaphamaparvovirus TaxID=2794490 RepID=A0A8A4XDL6_9VIRU|nr:MAG: VP1 [Grus japonensis Chaphamaparvovirus]